MVVGTAHNFELDHIVVFTQRWGCMEMMLSSWTNGNEHQNRLSLEKRRTTTEHNEWEGGHVTSGETWLKVKLDRLDEVPGMLLPSFKANMAWKMGV